MPLAVTRSDCLGEHALLARVLARLPRPPPACWSGRATMPRSMAAGRERAGWCVTTDAVVEGVHFSRAFSTPARHRAPGAGGQPERPGRDGRRRRDGRCCRWCCRADGSWTTWKRWWTGSSTLAQSTGVSVVGGNITRSPGPLVVDITAGGEVHPRRVVDARRRPAGDELWVSGTIGGAAAGLQMLRDGADTRVAGPTPACAVPAAATPSRLGVAIARGARGAGGDGLE